MLGVSGELAYEGQLTEFGSTCYCFACGTPRLELFEGVVDDSSVLENHDSRYRLLRLEVTLVHPTRRTRQVTPQQIVQWARPTRRALGLALRQGREFQRVVPSGAANLTVNIRAIIIKSAADPTYFLSQTMGGFPLYNTEMSVPSTQDNTPRRRTIVCCICDYILRPLPTQLAAIVIEARRIAESLAYPMRYVILFMTSIASFRPIVQRPRRAALLGPKLI